MVHLSFYMMYVNAKTPGTHGNTITYLPYAPGVLF